MSTINRALRGRRIQSFRIVDNVVCRISFDGEYALTSETLLRFIGTTGEFITAEDHNQKFGLPSPFDAEAAISTEIVGKEIQSVEICSKTGDLRMLLVGGVIEIIASSSGYESFQLMGAADWIVVGVGGNQQAEQNQQSRERWPPPTSSILLHGF